MVKSASAKAMKAQGAASLRVNNDGKQWTNPPVQDETLGIVTAQDMAQDYTGAMIRAKLGGTKGGMKGEYLK